MYFIYILTYYFVDTCIWLNYVISFLYFLSQSCCNDRFVKNSMSCVVVSLTQPTLSNNHFLPIVSGISTQEVTVLQFYIKLYNTINLQLQLVCYAVIRSSPFEDIWF